MKTLSLEFLLICGHIFNLICNGAVEEIFHANGRKLKISGNPDSLLGRNASTNIIYYNNEIQATVDAKLLVHVVNNHHYYTNKSVKHKANKKNLNGSKNSLENTLAKVYDIPGEAKNETKTYIFGFRNITTEGQSTPLQHEGFAQRLLTVLSELNNRNKNLRKNTDIIANLKESAVKYGHNSNPVNEIHPNRNDRNSSLLVNEIRKFLSSDNKRKNDGVTRNISKEKKPPPFWQKYIDVEERKNEIIERERDRYSKDLNRENEDFSNKFQDRDSDSSKNPRDRHEHDDKEADRRDDEEYNRDDNRNSDEDRKSDSDLTTNDEDVAEYDDVHERDKRNKKAN